jgi:hypothetical protein
MVHVRGAHETALADPAGERPILYERESQQYWHQCQIGQANLHGFFQNFEVCWSQRLI